MNDPLAINFFLFKPMFFERGLEIHPVGYTTVSTPLNDLFIDKTDLLNYESFKYKSENKLDKPRTWLEGN